MSLYKLAAFDMDGTLLNSAKEIQPSAAAAFKRAIQAGRILALDTGRAVTELRQYPFTEMGVRYGACACGTVIYDFQENRVLAKKTIPAELIPRIVAASREEDLMFQAMVDGISYVEEASVKRMDHYQMGIYRPLYEETTCYAEDVRSFALAHADSINKINLYHTDPESRERGRENVWPACRWTLPTRRPLPLRSRRRAYRRGPDCGTCAVCWTFRSTRPSGSGTLSMMFPCCGWRALALPWAIPMKQH